MANCDQQVLNPVLYDALITRFGEVTISSAGIRAHVSYYRRGGKLRVQVTNGEYYKVNCPLCKDTRQRLWISHMFGVRDKRTKQRVWNCAICYNERCDLTKLDLPDLLRPNFSKIDKIDLNSPESQVQTAIPSLKPIELPDADYIRLPDLPENHPARVYLEGRGFDVVQLDQYYLWKYCHTSRERFAERRIMLPVIAEIDSKAELVGFQTRAIPGWSTYEQPKYWTMPGFSKSSVLYNLPLASRHTVVVVTEGLMDVAKVGLNAVAMFGKSMSVRQRSLLVSTCSHAKIVILLDSDANNVAKNLRASLTVSSSSAGSHTLSNGVYCVQLPDGDPGDYSHTELSRMINAAIE